MGIESSRKVDDQKFEVTSSETVVRVHSLFDLKEERARVARQRQVNDEESARDLARLDALLAEAEKVGVVEPKAEEEPAVAADEPVVAESPAP